MRSFDPKSFECAMCSSLQFLRKFHITPDQFFTQRTAEKAFLQDFERHGRQNTGTITSKSMAWNSVLLRQEGEHPSSRTVLTTVLSSLFVDGRGADSSG